MEIKICAYSNSDYAAFQKMLCTCFWQDYKIPRTEEQLERWQNMLIRQASAEIVFIDLLTADGEAQGFILYQIDSPESDWCIKEGYGFIRELYVAADFRRSGHGKALAVHAETRLRQRGVPGIYLTTDEAMEFWAKMGYRDSGEVCSENDGRIFVK
ncbi:MAG: GNAT family N-acetyltransferase [Firmicutes bacterium]|nr:GNAT family N-acetyltransferase [Bacillota bacterium]